ncbi:MAG TPA: 50S ribosomal protein L4 [Mariprofundaceae bacterium]|nr:50S ribosomal protein L4 [Mariprofundaceae bacterium]
MPEIAVVDQKNKKVGKCVLNDAVFGLDSDAGFVHRVYAALAAAQRAGTHSTKTRTDVSGGGKKPWRQKGTGRARQGSTRAAQWRHGGTAHGPQPRSYATRINKKERRRAFCLVLSDAVRDGKVTVLDKIELSQIKTKEFVQVLGNLKVESGLLVLGDENREVALSGRNVPNAKVVQDGQLNLHDLLKYDHLILTQDAVSKLEERLA